MSPWNIVQVPLLWAVFWAVALLCVVLAPESLVREAAPAIALLALTTGGHLLWTVWKALLSTPEP